MARMGIAGLMKRFSPLGTDWERRGREDRQQAHELNLARTQEQGSTNRQLLANQGQLQDTQAQNRGNMARQLLSERSATNRMGMQEQGLANRLGVQEQGLMDRLQKQNESAQSLANIQETGATDRAILQDKLARDRLPFDMDVAAAERQDASMGNLVKLLDDEGFGNSGTTQAKSSLINMLLQRLMGGGR